MTHEEISLRVRKRRRHASQQETHEHVNLKLEAYKHDDNQLTKTQEDINLI